MRSPLDNNPSVVPQRMPAEWALKPIYSGRTLLAIFLIVILLAISAHRTEIDRMLRMSGEAVAVMFGVQDTSQVSNGLGRIAVDLFPLELSNVRELSRVENFTRDNLPWFSYIETRSFNESNLNTNTLEMEQVVVEREVLVEPMGYLLHVAKLMLQTIEIAFWGTLFAILLAVPLAFFGARNYSPNPVFYHLARSFSSLLRAIPELISALFLVLAFGFGPIAGVLALGLHTAGFLGKFFAEDIENADKGPQDALRCTGANCIKVLGHAVLPQVLPSYLGYVQYILERNIRTATVIGIVGAGGIGQELKGRFEMFNFGHVATILLVIFITVIVLEYLTGRARARLF